MQSILTVALSTSSGLHGCDLHIVGFGKGSHTVALSTLLLFLFHYYWNVLLMTEV
uniref:Uncharacterized protein n=1 Tax=Rhizophora mucronata TaxID=61149 RepID=A0A2P2QV16_RHIMU